MMTEKRRELIAALRAPLDFKWDFSRVSGCAFRVCRTLELRTPFLKAGQYDSQLELTSEQIDGIFGVMPNGSLYDCPDAEVTPQMVADALENAS